jgi:hypothetical protein
MRGIPDYFVSLGFAANEFLHTTPHLCLSAAEKGRACLCIQVPEKNLLSFLCGEIRQIHGSGGFAHSAFCIVKR